METPNAPIKVPNALMAEIMTFDRYLAGFQKLSPLGLEAARRRSQQAVQEFFDEVLSHYANGTMKRTEEARIDYAGSWVAAFEGGVIELSAKEKCHIHTSFTHETVHETTPEYHMEHIDVALDYDYNPELFKNKTL